MSKKTIDRLRKAVRKATGKADVAIRRTRSKVKGELRQGRARKASKVTAEVVKSGTALLAGLAIEQTARAIRARRSRALPLVLAEFELPMPMEAAVERLAEGLRAEGFGILTRIDVHTTLKEKLGASFRPYLILGVCNPALAHRALAARAETGLVLPCNVTVEQTPTHTTLVRIADPEAMLPSLAGDSGIREIAADAKQRLARAGRTVRAHAGAVVL
jgi:uncharacterized protein (DUF302 family)